MLIAAIVCGLVTAYYFGVRAGVYAAAAGAALVLVGIVVPPWSKWAYSLLAIGLVGVCLLGPRVGKPLGQRKAVLAARAAWARATSAFRRSA
jgi:hypothetical protein